MDITVKLNRSEALEAFDNNESAGVGGEFCGTEPCPSWQYCSSNGQCKCGDSPHYIVQCEGNKTLALLDCFCATFNKQTNCTELGPCLLNCERPVHHELTNVYKDYPANVLELNEDLCGKFNRQGSLCGSCKDGYFPLAYSYNMTCVKCEETWYNWIEYLLIVYVPLTIFYLVILFFQVNMTSSYWIGFVVYSQAISFPMMCRIAELSYHSGLRFKIPLQVTLSIYGLWNLDFFRVLNNRTCLRLHFLSVTLLDYVSGMYPLLLILLTYVGVQLYDANIKIVVLATRPFRKLSTQFRNNFEMRTSLIDAFATFFLLSSMKLFNVSSDLLFPATVHSLSPSGGFTTSHRLYLSGEIELFGRTHFPYGACAVLGIFISAVLPALLLALYPFQFFQKCLNILPNRWQIVLHTCVDIVQNSFKDGTDRKTRDFRWFSSFFFVLRLEIVIAYCLTFNSMYFALAGIALTTFSAILLTFQPFKDTNSKKDFLTPSFIIYLSCVYICLLGSDLASAKLYSHKKIFQGLGITMGFAPLLYLCCLVGYHFVQQFLPIHFHYNSVYKNI